VTDTEIHIGQTGPLSGPARIWGGTVKGAALRCKMANENGGIHGRKIVHHTYDDGYNPAKSKAGVKRLQESIGMFAWLGIVGTSNGQAVMDYLVQREIPWVGPFSGSTAWYDPPQKTVFSLYPPYWFEAEVLCEYAVKQQKKTNIAVVYQDDGYGRSGLHGAQKALTQYDLTLAAAIPVERDNIKYSEVVAKLARAKSDAVLMWINPFSVLRLLRVAKQADISPQWMVSSSLSSFKTFYPLTKGLIEGLISVNYATHEESILKRFKQAKAKLAPEDRWNTTYIAGMAYADVMLEALKRCGRDLTREKFIKAMESLEGYKNLTSRIRFAPYDSESPLCRLGQRAIYLQQCQKGGAVKILTDWIKMK